MHDVFSKESEILLGKELWEISVDGVIHSREDICSWLMKKSLDTRWDIKNFQVQSLSGEVVLSTYWAKMLAPISSESLGSLHSSLWKQNSEEIWQMIFHQSTKIL